jgi:hypothetical protein
MKPAPDNPSSWQRAFEHIASYPDADTWLDCKIVARRFVEQGMATRLDLHFRAGQSTHHLVFSTLGHRGQGRDPFVTIAIPPEVKQSEMQIQVACGTNNLWFGEPELSYTLAWDDAFSTFRRFLLQLWTATRSEPIPEAIRSPLAPNHAPILPHA